MISSCKDVTKVERFVTGDRLAVLGHDTRGTLMGPHPSSPHLRGPQERRPEARAEIPGERRGKRVNLKLYPRRRAMRTS